MRVHHTKCIVTHAHAGKHRYTYIMDNAITQSRKVNHIFLAIQGYGLARYRKSKIGIVIPKECGPSKKQENKMGYMEGPLIHALEKRLKERESEDCFEGARPPNLL